MRKFLVSWAVGGLALWVASLVLGGRMEFASFWDVVWTALLFGLLNALLGPLLKILTCPLYILTLGLLRFIFCGVFLLIADSLVRGFEISGFLWAVVASVIVSVVTTVLSAQLRDGKQE